MEASQLQWVTIVPLIVTLFICRSESNEECTPGAFLKGPDCSQFYRCVFHQKILFDCGPGTIFSEIHNVCVHGDPNNCPKVSGLPIPPQEVGNVQLGPPSSGSPPPGLPPGHAPSGSTSICSKYQVDPNGVYDCEQPGSFPSYGDCSSFYRCIHTMNCIIKGFFVKCPANYRFDSKTSECQPERKIGPCTLAQDPASQPNIHPVIQLQPENVGDFFSAQAYWDAVKFLPEENQKVIPKEMPASFSRGFREGVFHMN